MSSPICQIHRLGLIDYQKAWNLQNQFVSEIAAGERPPTLLLLEHPHTYTFGRRGDAANLLWHATELAQRGVTVHWVDRGGDVTYHGPGQLVGYPLIPLGSPSFQKVDYIGYIRKLEQVIIAAAGNFGVEAKQVEGMTGVWVDSNESVVTSEQVASSDPPSTFSHLPSIAKLAAIGIKVDARGVTRHGFALNVNPDMEYWEGIIGCGLQYPEISLAQLLDPVPAMKLVSDTILRCFGDIFEFEISAVE